MKKFIQEKEWWVILFIMGIIVLNYPLIQVFNQTINILGYPLFFLYLNVGWLLSIFTIYLYTKSIGPK